MSKQDQLKQQLSTLKDICQNFKAICQEFKTDQNIRASKQKNSIRISKALLDMKRSARRLR
jgi:uncharacterized protein (DUF362 family)